MLNLLGGTLLMSLFLVGLFMSLVFVLSIFLRNNGVADVAWGLSFILSTASAYLLNDSRSLLGLILTSLVVVWGVRLTLRIFLKNYGKPEDFRYRVWRESWGKWFGARSFLQIYMLQGFLGVLVALPVLIVNTYGGDMGLLAYMGLALWTAGFFLEAVADYQLDKFLREPANRGRIMMSGLWKYSRHPNYFGESLMWWGLALAALSSPYGGLALVAPALITFLLLKVSGVPMLEARFAGNPEWEAYKAQTSMFVPWFPKTNS